VSARLLVAQPGAPLTHARFDDLPAHLQPGDLLVVNESATLPAALEAIREDGERVQLHLSTPYPDGPPTRWTVELRRAGHRVRDGHAGERLMLPGGALARLVAPYPGTKPPGGLVPSRLWVAELELPAPLLEYLAEHGAPIRYAHDLTPRPLSDFQTIFSRVPGSAEMPSAGHPFTHRTLHDLAARGVGVARLVLHTGVSSQERGERPYPERFAVPAATAARANATRRAGGRVIAVGTTVTRALESAAGPDGRLRAAAGWTPLVITAARGVRAVDGLVTGWHDPEASHLDLLEAVGGQELVAASYAAAADAGYRRHEHGDSHLLLGQAAAAATGNSRRIA
jgi:S-adenosylmethionine:tRNA ribosyltransferase-isomerase